MINLKIKQNPYKNTKPEVEAPIGRNRDLKCQKCQVVGHISKECPDERKKWKIFHGLMIGENSK